MSREVATEGRPTLVGRGVARAVTETTSPTLLAPALLIAVSGDRVSGDGWSAVGWGAVAAFFVGVLPLAFLKLGARAGRWTDHHVEDRRSRPLPLAFGMVSVCAGIAILAWGGAPSQILGLVVAMLAGLAVVLAVSLWWKVSIHSAVAAGTTVILGLTFGWIGWLIGAVLAAGASWSRLALGKHTPAQVAVGLVIGAAVAGSIFPVLR